MSAFIAFLLSFALLVPAYAQQPPVTPSPELAKLTERGIYYDVDGLIVHRAHDGKVDGGDTSQREGWYWLGVWLRQNTPGLSPWPHSRKLTFEQVLRLLEPGGDGVFYRHPKLPPWNNAFSKEWGTSRDQLVPLIAAMGVHGRRDELMRLWDAMPDDVLGKHAFNGNWRNFLGQDGPNCGDIKKRGCDATADCSLKVDDRSCPLKEYAEDCSLQQDTRDCSHPRDDTRDCGGACILPNIFTGGCSQRGNDPICEAAKGTQNAGYRAARASCEVQKVAQNVAYSAAKLECETRKTARNGLYAKEKFDCEASKGTQNAFYASEKLACETGKTTAKMACETDKASAHLLCRSTNVFSGDILGPSATSLFRRSIDHNPAIPLPADLLSTAVVYGGALGDGELLVGSQVRIAASEKNRDDVGDDLNHIVQLVMAQLRYGSTMSKAAANTYYSSRQHSYGSYLGAYYATYGADMSDFMGRMERGVESGWKADTSAAFGAIKWYHRPTEGANPLLAELWKPIVERYILLSAGTP
jgi:hypothetical protein